MSSTVTYDLPFKTNNWKYIIEDNITLDHLTMAVLTVGICYYEPYKLKLLLKSGKVEMKFNYEFLKTARRVDEMTIGAASLVAKRYTVRRTRYSTVTIRSGGRSASKKMSLSCTAFDNLALVTARFEEIQRSVKQRKDEDMTTYSEHSDEIFSLEQQVWVPRIPVEISILVPTLLRYLMCQTEHCYYMCDGDDWQAKTLRAISHALKHGGAYIQKVLDSEIWEHVSPRQLEMIIRKTLAAKYDYVPTGVYLHSVSQTSYAADIHRHFIKFVKNLYYDAGKIDDTVELCKCLEYIKDVPCLCMDVFEDSSDG